MESGAQDGGPASAVKLVGQVGQKEEGGCVDFDPEWEAHYVSKKDPIHMLHRAISKRRATQTPLDWFCVTHVSPLLRPDVEARVGGATFRLGAYQAACFARAVAAHDGAAARQVEAATTMWDVCHAWKRLDQKYARSVWVHHAQAILGTVYMSLAQGSDSVRQLLLDTHPRYVAYVSLDATMGVGPPTVAAAKAAAELSGDNLCGEAMMDVRVALRSDPDAAAWRHLERARTREDRRAHPNSAPVVGPIEIVGE
jgi:predicted NAD-dependent protein-ADP-ribosyltransferase YbiA (DUF1768 family)